MAKRIGTRKFAKRKEDSDALEGITLRLNEWLGAQEANVRIINIETLPLAFELAIRVWYEVEDEDQQK